MIGGHDYGTGLNLYEMWYYFISDISLTHIGTQALGKYGRMRRTFLEQNKHIFFNDLVLTEPPFPHLWEIQQTCEKRVDLLMKELLIKNPAPDKATHRSAWVAHISSLKAQV